MSREIALIGNPNSGKTTLFNTLTGTHQKVGNWSGVTTEKKVGEYLKDKSLKIVDLPGVYSFNAKSKDEQAVLNYLKEKKPTLIVNVVDGNRLERSLYLTCELIKLDIPLVVAINFCDELQKNGISPDTGALENVLGVKVLLISAAKNINIDELIRHCKEYKDQNNQIKAATIKKLATEKQKSDYLRPLLKTVLFRKKTRAEKFTEKADRILLGKFSGYFIFVAVMIAVYYLSITIGGVIGQQVGGFFSTISNGARNFLRSKNSPAWITSMTCDAIINGIGAVLSFLPQLLILFALLSLLEQSGYAARTAFLTDRIFRFAGLSGKSFIPLMLGCGCTVSGLMATRTIDDENGKIMTVYLTPFMPCGAKTAVFGWFSAKIFGGNALVAASMYFLGIICACVFGRLLKKSPRLSKSGGTFALEIPTLRLPRMKDTLIVLLEKTKDFITKAGLIVFVVSVITWALSNIGIHGYTDGKIEQSFLYSFGNAFKFIFYPLGFGSWQATVALTSGIFAKEAVIESLGLLSENVSEIFPSAYTAYAFCAFVLLSPPCVASIAQAKRELGDKGQVARMVVFQFVVGYAVAFIINGAGFIIENGLLLSVVVGIIITLTVVMAIKKIKKSACGGDCQKCREERKCKAKEKPYTI